jgi:site-specific DNA-methyltransferase (adenine-specific)
MKWTDKITVTNEDNMTLMARYPDNYFNLAIVDPPYGLGKHNAIGNGDKRNGVTKNKIWIGGEWDNNKPSIIYFKELFRVSKHQIIWGGNYFTNLIPQSDKWLVWDKMQRINQSDCELAWTSFIGALRIFKYHSSKLQGFMNPDRFHPTEKPVNLYKWLLQNYAKENDKILDTHLGSGSIALACHELGFELTACELDAEYYNASLKRFKLETKQLMLDL